MTPTHQFNGHTRDLQTWTVAGHLGAGVGSVAPGHAAASAGGAVGNDSTMSERQWSDLRDVLVNELSRRWDPLRGGGGGTDRRRDVRAECGWPRAMPDALEFLRLYQQDAMAGVVVDRVCDETFKAPGEVWDGGDDEGDAKTPFVAAVDAVGGRVNVREGESYYEEEEYNPLWTLLCDWDKASRVGRFGLLLIGLDDGLPLSRPAAGVIEEGSAPEGFAYDYLPDEMRSRDADPYVDEYSRIVRGDYGRAGPDDGPAQPRYRGMKVKFRRKKVTNADGSTREELVVTTNAQARRNKGTKDRAPVPYRLRVDRAVMNAAHGKPPAADDDEDEPTGATGGDADPADGEEDAEAPKSVERLLYCRVFTEASVTAVRWERNRTSPRYGRPTHYHVDFGDPLGNARHVGPSDAQEVHWTRVLVLPSDARLAHSPHEGVPACWPVWPELSNLQKITGAGGEGYWRSGVPMIAYKTPPAVSGMPTARVNTATIRAEHEKMMNSLDRAGVFKELQPEILAPSVVDPTPFVAVNHERIAAALNMPVRKLLGSERGELASSEDEGDWNDEVRRRQGRRTVPHQLVPLIDRLILLGVLPEPQGGVYKCGWPAVDALGKKEKSEIFAQDMTALKTYIEGQCDTVMDPETMAARYLDMTAAEARAMLDAAAEASAERVEQEQERAVEEQSRMIDEGLAPDPVAESEAKIEALKKGKPVAAGPPTKVPKPKTNARKRTGAKS